MENKVATNNKMAKKSSTPSTTATPVVASPATPVAESAPVKKTKASKKDTTQEVSSAQTTTPVTVSATPSSAPATDVKPTKKASSKKTTTPVESAPASTPVVPAPVEAESVPAAVSTSATEAVSTEPVSVTAAMELLLSQNESLLNQQRELVAGIKKLMKAYQRERKDAERHTRTRKPRDPTKAREPSGFAVPTQISEKLCDFLAVAHGSKLSRTEVTKKINSYIKTNNLQVPENKRSFKPDAKLSAILGNLQAVDAEKGYTYFNLQRYMTPHFVYATSA